MDIERVARSVRLPDYRPVVGLSLRLAFTHLEKILSVWIFVAALTWFAIVGLWLTAGQYKPVLTSPDRTFALYNAFFCFVALLLDYDYPIFAAGLAWIALSTLSFWLGYGGGPANIDFAKSPDSQPPRVALWIGCVVLAALGLTGAILLNEQAAAAVAAGNDLENIADVVTAQLAASYSQYETGDFVRTFAHAFLPFCFAAAIVGGLLCGLYPRFSAVAALLAFTTPVVSVFLSGARTTLVLCFVLFFGALISGRLLLTKSSTVGIRSVAASVMALIVAVTVVYFWRWGNIGDLEYGGLFSRLEQAANVIQGGGFASLPQFSQWLAEYWTADNDLTWGARLFRGPVGLIGEFYGFSVPRVFESWIIGSRLDDANIFTIHRVLIEDFGLWAIFLWFFVGRAARYWRAGVYRGSLYAAIMLGTVYSTIFESMIDFPFNNTVSLVAVPLALLTAAFSSFVDRILAERGAATPAVGEKFEIDDVPAE